MEVLNENQLMIPENYSSADKMFRITAIVFRFVYNIKARLARKKIDKSSPPPLALLAKKVLDEKQKVAPKVENDKDPAVVKDTFAQTENTEIVNLHETGNIETEVKTGTYKHSEKKGELKYTVSAPKKVRILILHKQEIQRAEDYWTDQSMRITVEEFSKNRFQSLRARQTEIARLQPFPMVKPVVAGGRAQKGLMQYYEISEMTMLTDKHHIAYLILKQLHDLDHSGSDNHVIGMSRHSYWIVRAGKVIRKIRSRCMKCRLSEKKLDKQIMAPLPPHRQSISRPFDHINLDIFGPLTIRDTVKRRTTKKVWGIAIICGSTRAVHLDISGGYDMQSVMDTLNRFFFMKGCPVTITSDMGSQLRAAGKRLNKLEELEQMGPGIHLEELKKEIAKQGLIWNFVPVRGQHQNGLAENLVKRAKRVLVPKIEGMNFDFPQLQTILFEIAYIINSHPLSIKPMPDPLDNPPITPNSLLLGRSSKEPRLGYAPENKLELSRRTTAMEELMKDWWTKWRKQVFSALIPSYRWQYKFRQARVGDVVLMNNSSDLKGQYKLGIIDQILPSLEDQIVRKVVVKYKNAEHNTDLKNTKYKFSERPIQNLVTIFPINFDEKDLEEGDKQE